MVGNDIVDLGDAETCNGPSHPGFDARVFAPVERKALAASPAPNRLRWSLWAAKEAAYKLGVKRTPGLVFSPRRFVVSLRPDLSGSVSFPGGVADLALRSDGDAIHAVATERGGRAFVAAIASADAAVDASKAVRGLVQQRMAQCLGVTPNALRIGRRGRVPTLKLRGDSRHFDLSLSHHGRYLAFACEVGEATGE